MKQSTKVKKECRECRKEFFIFKAWLRSGKGGKYCSRPCRSIGSTKEFPQKKHWVSKVCVICAKLFSVKRYRNNSATCCSGECRSIRLGRIISGEKHWNWKGGNTERGFESKKWAQRVKKRDGKCKVCGSFDGLQAHHIVSWAKNTDLRYDISNGVTLCKECHAIEHPNLSFWINRK